MEYPKIETLWNRGPDFKVVPGEYRKPEFRLPREWLVTEKIDGTNVRVLFRNAPDHFGSDDDQHVQYAGRTDRAQMYVPLMRYLHQTFTAAKLLAAFGPGVTGVLYGEGYGAGIQRGGVYRPDPAVRLFDVRVGDWWLNWTDVADVALKLGIETVPSLGRVYLYEVVAKVSDGSRVARDESESGVVTAMEGVVARTDPLLFDQAGDRVMWKLKGKDLRQGGAR